MDMLSLEHAQTSNFQVSNYSFDKKIKIPLHI